MKLNATQLPPLLADLPQWTHHDERGGILKREFVFHDFAQAFGFMGQFHVYNRVAVTLAPHDVGGLSMNDIDMARLMDRIAAALAQQAV